MSYSEEFEFLDRKLKKENASHNKGVYEIDQLFQKVDRELTRWKKMTFFSLGIGLFCAILLTMVGK